MQQTDREIHLTISDNWDKIKETIRVETDCNDVSFHTWIEPLVYLGFSDDTAHIMIPYDEAFQINYLNTHYLQPFTFFISNCVGEMIDVSFHLKKDAAKLSFSAEGGSVPDTSSAPEEKSEEELTDGEASILYNFPDKYRFESFVVGSNNHLAFAAALAVAESPGRAYNPLFIYGKSGLGKTHLMSAIGHHIRENDPDMKVLYVTSEHFTNEVIESIRRGKSDPKVMTELRERYRSVDVLMIDDVQFIIGKDSTQEEFFHTFNWLHQAGKQIVLSSDRPPREMELLDDRFRSRFEMGLLTDIKSPEYETRMAILKRLSEDYPCVIEDKAFSYIADNVRSNIRELEGTFNQLIAFARMNKLNNVTLEVATEALKDYISPDRTNRITIRLVIDTVCEHYGITPDRLKSSARNKELVVPRQIVMYLCREYCNNATLKEIATSLGKKDHTTVSSGVEKIKADLLREPELARNVEIIVNKLNPVV